MAGVFRVTAEAPRGSLALAPAYNALNSLSLLHAVEEFPAVDEWVRRTAAALSVPQIKLNRVLFDELGEVLVVGEPDQNFPSYLAALASQRTDDLRARILTENASNGDAARLSDEAAALLSNPVRLRETIVAHLRELWERYLEPEWASAERKLNLNLSYLVRSTPGSGVPPEAIMANLQRYIAGTSGHRAESQAIVFVPSPHTGRYTTSLQAGSSLYLFFDAALHMELLMRNTRVSQAELVGRLSALAEPARLHVLAALAQHDDVTLQDLMDQLETSQPNVSRYLKSLRPFLEERRDRDGRKRYRLVTAQLDLTLNALRQAVLAPPHAAEVLEEKSPSSGLARFLDAKGLMRAWPGRETDRRELLRYLADKFAPSQTYGEKAVNALLIEHVPPYVRDHVTVRRDLVDAHWLERSDNGAQYWRGSGDSSRSRTVSDDEAYARYWGGESHSQH
jgi:DNA-binding MarR family transcriptional regulator